MHFATLIISISSFALVAVAGGLQTEQHKENTEQEYIDVLYDLVDMSTKQKFNNDVAKSEKQFIAKAEHDGM